MITRERLTAEINRLTVVVADLRADNDRARARRYDWSSLQDGVRNLAEREERRRALEDQADRDVAVEMNRAWAAHNAEPFGTPPATPFFPVVVGGMQRDQAIAAGVLLAQSAHSKLAAGINPADVERASW